jgi:D-amino-acid oxidase
MLTNSNIDTNVISLEHSKRWCMVAYHIFQGIASIPSLSQKSGIKMLPSAFFYHSQIESRKQDHSKMTEIIASGVRGFHRDPTRLVDDNCVSKSYGIVDAYELQSPVIDTDQAMDWLMSLVKGKGAPFVTETIEQDLIDVEGFLLRRFNADVIVNATGLESNILAGDDTVYPIRGGLLRVINDGSDFPKVKSALTITSPESQSDIVFLVPRNDDILIVGGFTEPHEWNLDLTPDSPIVRRMKERCEKFLPGLKNARLDEKYPLAQGLRPFRGENVRVERELRRRGSRIVHTYGQGGAGWSLSFGCAQDVLKLVNEALAGLPASSMVGSGKVVQQSRL